MRPMRMKTAAALSGCVLVMTACSQGNEAAESENRTFDGGSARTLVDWCPSYAEFHDTQYGSWAPQAFADLVDDVADTPPQVPAEFTDYLIDVSGALRDAVDEFVAGGGDPHEVLPDGPYGAEPLGAWVDTYYEAGSDPALLETHEAFVAFADDACTNPEATPEVEDGGGDDGDATPVGPDDVNDETACRLLTQELAEQALGPAELNPEDSAVPIPGGASCTYSWLRPEGCWDDAEEGFVDCPSISTYISLVLFDPQEWEGELGPDAMRSNCGDSTYREVQELPSGIECLRTFDGEVFQDSVAWEQGGVWFALEINIDGGSISVGEETATNIALEIAGS
jgi:hypothetical protein